MFLGKQRTLTLPVHLVHYSFFLFFFHFYLFVWCFICSCDILMQNVKISTKMTEELMIGHFRYQNLTLATTWKKKKKTQLSEENELQLHQQIKEPAIKTKVGLGAQKCLTYPAPLFAPVKSRMFKIQEESSFNSVALLNCLLTSHFHFVDMLYLSFNYHHAMTTHYAGDFALKAILYGKNNLIKSSKKCIDKDINSR